MEEELKFYEQGSGSTPTEIDYYVKASKVKVNTGNGITSDNAQSALEELAAGVGALSVTAAKAPLMKNHPYPYGKEVLKILAIGNSFTEYPLDYLGSMLSSSGCDTTKVCIYAMTAPGQDLEYWLNAYEAGTHDANTVANKRVGSASVASGGGATTQPNSATVASVLANDWDIVVFQQLSSKAATYSTYNPYLKKLVQAVRRHCPNKRVAIAWQMVWTRTTNPATSITNIVNATQQMCAYNGIDIIIPSGMALENAKGNSTLNSNGGSLLADGVHPARGVGKYVVSAAWWEALLAPHFDVSILGNTFVHTPNGSTVNITGTGEDATTNSVAVTNDNKELCQLAAVYAVGNMYEVTTLSSTTT